MSNPLLGAVAAGGSKFVCALGSRAGVIGALELAHDCLGART